MHKRVGQGNIVHQTLMSVTLNCIPYNTQGKEEESEL